MTRKNLLCMVAVLTAAPVVRAAAPSANPAAPPASVPIPPSPSTPGSTPPEVKKEPGPAAKDANALLASAQPTEAAPLEEIVHGFFMQMRVGGGYMVKGSTIPQDNAFPTLQGASESFGSGPAVDFALGYEVADTVALQLIGGMTFSGGRRTDRVRGLAITYGGAGIRLAIPMSERLNLVIAPNIAYASSSTAVEAAMDGLMVVLNGGFEYYVHVRHISVGADLSVQAPFDPLRIFVGILPYIRYAF